VTYFATIEQTRHGWHANFWRRNHWTSVGLEYPHFTGSSWRRTREKVERAAERELDRLNMAAQERARLAATSYVFEPARTARAD